MFVSGRRGQTTSVSCVSHVAVPWFYQVEGGRTMSVPCVTFGSVMIVSGRRGQTISCVSDVAVSWLYQVEGGRTMSVSCVTFGSVMIVSGRRGQTPSVSCVSDVAVSCLYQWAPVSCVSQSLYQGEMSQTLSVSCESHVTTVSGRGHIYDMETHMDLFHNRLYPQGDRTYVAMNCAHHCVYRWRMEDNVWIYGTWHIHCIRMFVFYCGKILHDTL